MAVARAAAADEWLAAHPPLVEWWGGRFDPALTDVADPIVTTLVDAVGSVTGLPALHRAVGSSQKVKVFLSSEMDHLEARPGS